MEEVFVPDVGRDVVDVGDGILQGPLFGANDYLQKFKIRNIDCFNTKFKKIISFITMISFFL